MTKDIPECLTRLKEEIHAREKAIARGSYVDLSDFARQQGILFGLEEAHSIVYRILAENEDSD